MLCLLLYAHDNGKCTVSYCQHIKHALPVVIRSWEQARLNIILSTYRTCFSCCYMFITTAKAWFSIINIWNMLRLLLCVHNNSQCIVFYGYHIKHALNVVICLWQLSRQDILLLPYRPCHASCYMFMTAVNTWYSIVNI